MNLNHIMSAPALQSNAISIEHLARSFAKRQTAILSSQERLRTSKTAPPEAGIDVASKKEKRQ